MRMKNVKVIEGKIWQIVVPQEPKIKVGFWLTFPKVNTWNGKWTGDGKSYSIIKPYNSKGKILYPDLKSGDYYYDFGDGWVARVEVKFITDKEAREEKKRSQGFCGYEWMVDSIIEKGKIEKKA